MSRVESPQKCKCRAPKPFCPFFRRARMNLKLVIITLYTWGTPNGRKISIMLENVQRWYDVVAVRLTVQRGMAVSGAAI